MKKFVKNLVLWKLVWLARIRLKRLRLFVIGVTGSMGKTTTKEAAYHILKSKYQVFRSEKSYNTEFGLPLTILEQKSGFSSPAAWVRTMLGAVWNAFIGGRHVQMMVVEMGVDKEGDMDQLLKLVRPQIGVMTNIAPVHLAEGQFKNLKEIFKEKSKLIKSLPEKGYAVLNADDPLVASLADEISCKKIMYGTSEGAELRATNVKEAWDGISFQVHYGEESAHVFAPVLGGFQIYTLLPAIGVAIAQGFSLEEAAEQLKDFRMPPGRMNPIPGTNDTMIIDSSYNASPEAMKQALDLLQKSESRKIAVLGNMNELGKESEKKHREVGEYVVGRADMLVTVGDFAKWIRDEAIKRGFLADTAHHFKVAEEAADFLSRELEKNDTILVKGSQNKVRLERLVKKLMKEPQLAPQLLARQGKEWEKVQ